MKTSATRGPVICLLTACCLLGAACGASAQDYSDVYGCEANPTGDPIGGGDGYRDIRTSGDFTVTTTEELLGALKQATAGQVIFVPDGVEIDLTETTGVVIPGGVTLAGTRGLDGSPGARLFTKRRGGTQFQSGGDLCRLTGLRFEGPFPGPELIAESATFFLMRHWSIEVDNNEIYNWNIQGVYSAPGASKGHVHHNYIHHCQRSGYGYGVVVYDSDVRIIANKFDYCRHHVAAGGNPGTSYEAAWNLIMPNCTSTCLDMHGGRDRGDNTDIAGDWMDIHHNTFEGPQRAVGIRGTPSQGAEIYNNWFFKPAEETTSSVGNTRVYNNVSGPEKSLQAQPIHFVDAQPVPYEPEQ